MSKKRDNVRGIKLMDDEITRMKDTRVLRTYTPEVNQLALKIAEQTTPSSDPNSHYQGSLTPLAPDYETKKQKGSPEKFDDAKLVGVERAVSRMFRDTLQSFTTNFAEALAKNVAEQIGLTDRLRRIENAITDLQRDRPEIARSLELQREVMQLNSEETRKEKEAFQKAFIKMAQLARINEYQMEALCNHLGYPYRPELATYMKNPRKAKKQRGVVDKRQEAKYRDEHHLLSEDDYCNSDVPREDQGGIFNTEK